VPERFDGLRAEALLADKACDSDKIIQSAQAQGMPVIIPSKVNQNMQRSLNKERCKARHLVDNLLQRMKVFHRVATRFDKLDTRYLGFGYIAGIMKWHH
jgi:transposase